MGRRREQKAMAKALAQVGEEMTRSFNDLAKTFERAGAAMAPKSKLGHSAYTTYNENVYPTLKRETMDGWAETMLKAQRPERPPPPPEPTNLDWLNEEIGRVRLNA
jgi:hypothetical protein